MLTNPPEHFNKSNIVVFLLKVVQSINQKLKSVFFNLNVFLLVFLTGA